MYLGFATKDGVVAIGEIGYDDITDAEDKRHFGCTAHTSLKNLPYPSWFTPRIEDKVAGSIRSMDVCEEMGLEPHMVVIDHNNEETVQAVLDRGFWAAFTLYPQTKMGSERMVEVIKRFGSDRIVVDWRSADWGVSDRCSVPKTAQLDASTRHRRERR